ncbi:2-dehydropantoate 2-reductase [Spirochaetia bacterium]|nr:2-dehydropantoate 2-reductase [Spirochaetia bacterium]
METAIYGAGAMGTVLGAYLGRAGIQTDLISRSKPHVEALRKNGARITGCAKFTAPVRALLPEEMEKKYGLVILLTKQTDNRAAAEKIAVFLEEGGVVLTLQNGIPEPGLAAVLGEDRVMGGIAVGGATLTGPGTAELTSKPEGRSFGIGIPWTGRPAEILKARLPEVRALLENICPVTVEENFIGLRWSKLLINAAFSGLSALTGWTFGRIARDRRGREYALRVIGECVTVCRAAGVVIRPVQGIHIEKFFPGFLPGLAARIVLPLAMKKHANIRSGMLGDLDRGRPCEIDGINGVVCDWGKKHGVPVPVNSRITELVHSIERGERKYCPENLDLLNETMIDI